MRENKNTGFVMWFTGLSQSGKSTIADGVYKTLLERGVKVKRLDGDSMRKYLSRDLGFSKSDRDENIRRAGILAKSFAKNGIGVIASFISPYREQRDNIRKGADNFIEIFCDCPLKICEKRDTKGLYKRAREGEIKNFTGVSDPYEKPVNPELILKTAKQADIIKNIRKVSDYLIKRKIA